ncbi:MAG: MerR family transcriptional regulator [Deltaproteobacteria bacterium]|nr:MerR family transcriptional regulator [Deltaproteobacteria bacterium]
MGPPPLPEKSFFRIGEVGRLLGLSPHVLRFWESEFRLLKPQKSRTGQRIYSRRDVERLGLLKRLLKEERYTLEGARKVLREKGLEPPAGSAPQVPPEARAEALRVALEAARARLGSLLGQIGTPEVASGLQSGQE